MAFVVCIKPFGDANPGDVVEIPDGAEASPLYFLPSDASGAITPDPAPEGN